MRLLFLTHRVPFPPNRGDRIRAYHLLRHVASRHDVSLGCVSDEDTSQTARAELAALCEQVAIEKTTRFERLFRDVASLARGRSATEGHFWSPVLAATLRGWSDANAFDAIICFCSSMYPYSQLRQLRDVPVIVDLVDVDSEKWRELALVSQPPVSWLQRLESLRVRRLENEIAKAARDIFLTTELEACDFARLTNCRTPRVANNGVDLAYFFPQAARSGETTSCSFVGVLDYQPNVEAVNWFVEEIFPRLQKHFPYLTFKIVGRSPSSSVKALERQPGVQVHANVPDVRPYLASSAVVVAPLRVARGVQNKVLEAMAMGRPVVASPAALSGITPKIREEVFSAENTDEWLSAITQLIEDSPLAAACGAAARRYCERNHDWDNCLAPFSEALSRVQRHGAEQRAYAV